MPEVVWEGPGDPPDLYAPGKWHSRFVDGKSVLVRYVPDPVPPPEAVPDFDWDAVGKLPFDEAVKAIRAVLPTTADARREFFRAGKQWIGVNQKELADLAEREWKEKFPNKPYQYFWMPILWEAIHETSALIAKENAHA